MHPLVQVTLDLTRPMPPSERYTKLLAAVRQTVPEADAASMVTVNPNEFRIIAVDGMPQAYVGMTMPVKGGPEFWDILSQQYEPMKKYPEDEPDEDVPSFAEGTPHAGKPAEVIIGSPLRVGGKLVGMIGFFAATRTGLDAVETERIESCSALAAAALHASDMMASLEAVAARRRDVAQQLSKSLHHESPAALVGDSSAMKLVRQEIAEVARNASTVFIRGDQGTGREAAARLIHTQSDRAGEAFIPVDPAATNHFDGGFWGTTCRWLGRDDEGLGLVDIATGGTLFFDYVDQLPLPVQRALATVIERLEEIRRSGLTPQPDVRIIVASAHDPDSESGSRRFDGALAGALYGPELQLPRLLDRPTDMPQLVEALVDELAHDMGITTPLHVDEAGFQHLEGHAWPGNVNELRDVLEGAVRKHEDGLVPIDERLFRATREVKGYTLERLLARGGMGEVWLGRHELLSRPVAIKTIRADALRTYGPKAMQRFLREARVTANLRSFHTVELYDFGVSDDGALYYVMEHLTGTDIKGLVHSHGPLSSARTIYLLKQACLSLAEAHDAGLVHRDIKPENLFVASMGLEYDILKVLDFGLVKTPASSKHKLTTDGIVHGTPGFMSPEAALGENVIDGRADLYSLGCVAYFMLTGELPFKARTPMDMLLKQVQDSPQAPSKVVPTVSPELDALVLACLQKRASQRPENAMAVLRLLEEAESALQPRWSQNDAAAWWRETGRAPA